MACAESAAEEETPATATPSEPCSPVQAALKSAIVGRRFSLTDREISGNFASTVLVGTANDSNDEVAVKVQMKRSFSSRPELMSAQAEAARHAEVLPHPNIVTLLAAEETAEAILVVTPLASRGDLWGLMEYGQTYGEGQVRDCAGQMLSAVRHLHDVCGLVHADVKPHNFLLKESDGRLAVQLCDFGFAERPGKGGEVEFTEARGTYGWLSPEMSQERDYGFPIDLFGVGLIIFRMLGGYHPFNPPSRFEATLEFDECSWCHIGDRCRDLVQTLLRLEPSARGTAAEACGHQWFSGPAPGRPTPEQLEALAAFGPPPDLSVEFWPADFDLELPARCSGDAGSSSTAARSRSASDDAASTDFGSPLSPRTPASPSLPASPAF